MEFPSVLLLDDDEFTMLFIEEMLREIGLTDVRTETDGRRALEVIQQQPPGLLIFDLNMPNLDGIEVVRSLADMQFAGAVILLSGADKHILQSTQLLVEQYGIRMLASIKKPASREQLSEALGHYLDQLPESRAGYLTAGDELSLEEVRAGITSGQVVPFFQPKVSTSGRKVKGAECLARWRTAEGKVLGPQTFIPVVESHGLSQAFLEALLVPTLALLAVWRAEGLEFGISINITADNLEQFDLPDYLEREMARHQIPHKYLTLELTEGRLYSNSRAALDVITRIRIKGFNLSIDDYGTGYSNLDSLKKMPFNELKVDRSFIVGAVSDAKTAAILQSTVTLGKALDLRTVAEGVETDRDFALVKSLGIDEVQGFGVARPMPSSDLSAWIAQWESQVSGGHVESLV